MKIKIKLLFLIFIWNSARYEAQSLECRDYHYGKFKFIDTKTNTNNRLERIGNKQIETDLNTGRTAIFNVKWTSECEYELTILEGGPEYLSFFRNKTLIIRIIERYNDGYRFEGHIKGTREFKTHIMRFL